MDNNRQPLISTGNWIVDGVESVGGAVCTRLMQGKDVTKASKFW
jgi:hypothetical protein